MAPNETEPPTDLKDQYVRLRPQLNAFLTAGVERLVESIGGSDLKLAVPVHGRVKSFSSALEKIARKGIPRTGLRGFPDLVGFRAVVTFPGQLEHACQLVERVFRVEDREHPASRLGPDQFGYASIHILVRPSEEMTDSSGSPIVPALMGEVQVRTLAQHLWADASHQLQYKVEADVPLNARRAVNRAAALLELVDEELGKVWRDNQTLARVTRSFADTPELTKQVVESVLNRMWPPGHRLESEPYGMLLADLRGRGVDSADALLSILHRHRAKVLDYASRYAERQLRSFEGGEIADGKVTIVRPGRTSIHMNVSEALMRRLRQGVFLGHSALTYAALDIEFEGRDPIADLLD